MDCFVCSLARSTFIHSIAYMLHLYHTTFALCKRILLGKLCAEPEQHQLAVAENKCLTAGLIVQVCGRSNNTELRVKKLTTGQVGWAQLTLRVAGA